MPRTLVIPAGTQPGRVFRLRGRGVPVLQGRGRGDLLVQIEVQVPERLSDEEADLLRQLAELRGEEVAAPERRRALLAHPFRVPVARVTARSPERDWAAGYAAVAHVFVDALDDALHRVGRRRSSSRTRPAAPRG